MTEINMTSTSNRKKKTPRDKLKAKVFKVLRRNAPNVTFEDASDVGDDKNSIFIRGSIVLDSGEKLSSITALSYHLLESFNGNINDIVVEIANGYNRDRVKKMREEYEKSM